MKKIKSFTIDHDYLEPGMYISRIDGDAVTYDIRMIKPNNPENTYLSPDGLHTIEHLLATYVRSSAYSDRIIYAGPMGCRTGFYLVTRDTLEGAQAVRLVRDAMHYIADFSGDIPGGARKECGNYLAHDLADAKQAAAAFTQVMDGWTAQQLPYPPKVQISEDE